MNFCQVVFILFFFFCPHFCFANQQNAGREIPVDLSEALHYHCSVSLLIDPEANPEPFKSATRVDHDFSLIYVKDLNRIYEKNLAMGVNFFPGQDFLPGKKQPLKPFLSFYGQYSIVKQDQTKIVRNLDLQTLILSQLSEVESFKEASSDHQGQVTVKNYFDIIAHILGLQKSEIQKNIQSEIVYYVGANMSGYGLLKFNELLNEFSGQPTIIGSRSKKVIMSLEVPVKFALLFEEPESFFVKASFHEMDPTKISDTRTSANFLCKKKDNLSNEDLQDIFVKHPSHSIPLSVKSKQVLHRLNEGEQPVYDPNYDPNGSYSGNIEIEKFREFKKGVSEGHSDNSFEQISTDPSFLESIDLEKLREIASAINQKKIEFYVLTGSTLAATFGSALLAGYRFLGWGGRQKILAGVLPPGLLYGWLGRTGYEIPSNEKYSVEDVKYFASQVASSKNEEDLRELLKKTDPDLIVYLQNIFLHIGKKVQQEKNQNYTDRI